MTEHFFVVGAQRAATTYAYHILAEHPEIEMAVPLKPEPKFFLLDELFERDLSFYESHFFNGKPGARLRGEKSTSYIESENAAKRIAQSFPRAKVLFLLRDPIERAISNYWFSMSNGLETLPMAQAFLQEDGRWQNYDHKRLSASPFAYLHRGRYIEYLSMYERYFPREQILTVLSERFVASPAGVRELYSALGVDPDFTPPSLGKRINKGEKLDAALPADVADYLVTYFAECNARLAERLGLDLGKWWKSGAAK